LVVTKQAHKKGPTELPEGHIPLPIKYKLDVRERDVLVQTSLTAFDGSRLGQSTPRDGWTDDSWTLRPPSLAPICIGVCSNERGNALVLPDYQYRDL
jgi:hypothetical protein